MGFTFSRKPALPLILNAHGSADFAVAFQASSTGGYRAALSSDGVSVLLTAAVVPGLTCEVQTASGIVALGASPLDFSSVPLGQAASRHILVSNRTPQTLIIPAINVGKNDFGLQGVPAAGTSLQPGQQSGFDVQFLPSISGRRTGSLAIGARIYTLTGAGVAPPTPQPQLRVSVQSAQSAQQGSVNVNFDAPAATSGSGTVTLHFVPGTAGTSGSAVAFASGGQTALFTFTPGDTQAWFGTGRAAAF